MAQEFQVLRCFSCQTFQVQQVKKSKKWSCKMCGEKQSLIKEYGRGTGADCRHHVQKLNSLHGKMLELENERAWTQWENHCEEENDLGDEVQSCEPQGEVQVESRWTKYVNQMDDETRGDEDEEDNVYTGREWFRSRGNISRKRRKTFYSKASSGRNTDCENEDTDTGSELVYGRSKALPFQQQQNAGSFRSLSAINRSSRSPSFTISSRKAPTTALCHTSASSLNSKHISQHADMNSITTNRAEGNELCSIELTTNHHNSVAANSCFLPSPSGQSSKENKMESKSSKWTRFLTAVSAEESSHEEEEDNSAQMSAWGTKEPPSSSAPRPQLPIHTVAPEKRGRLDPLDQVSGLGNSTLSVFEKLSHCLTETTSYQSGSPTFTARSSGAQKPVCLQPPPTKRPFPALSFSTMFHTEEDFDEAI